MAEFSKEYRFDPRQQRFWWKATLFFDWCDQHLRKTLKRLDDKSRRDYQAGTVPTELMDIARKELSEKLSTSLPLPEAHEVVKRVLPSENDYDAWMNSPCHDKSGLPKRITDTVLKAVKAVGKKRHKEFFKEVNRRRMKHYFQVWQSKERAHLILVLLARGEMLVDETTKKYRTSTIRLGNVRFDHKLWIIRHIQTTGGLDGRGVKETLERIKGEGDKEFAAEVEKTLARVKKSGRLAPEVEWERVHDVAKYLVEHWCGFQAAVHLPPLCLYQSKSLVKYCDFGMDKPTLVRPEGPQNIRKWISRLRLKRAEFPKVGDVTFLNSTISFKK